MPIHPNTRQALLAAFLLAACSPGQPDSPNAQKASPEPAMLVTESHDGTHIPLRPGEVFEVRLHGNETIDPPVAWSLVSAPPFLRAAAPTIVPDDPEADGAGATWIFRFTAQGEGSGHLVFAGGASGRRVSYEAVSDETMVID